MKEALITEVLISKEETAELEIIYEQDVLEFRVAGEVVFSGDWSGNFLKIFKKALKIWDE